MGIIINELKEMKDYIDKVYKIGLLKFEILNDYNKIRFIEFSNQLNELDIINYEEGEEEQFEQFKNDSYIDFFINNTNDLHKYADSNLNEIIKSNQLLNEIEFRDLFELFNLTLEQNESVNTKYIENSNFEFLEDGVLLKYLHCENELEILLFEEDLLLVDLYDDVNELILKKILLKNLLCLKNEKFKLFFENLLRF